MRILMVTPYPPSRDGLANYAVQEVKRLRAEGHDVEVLSPGPSAAHHHLDLRGTRGALALGKRVRGYDRVIVQFHPAVFFEEAVPPRRRAATAAALAVTFRAARDLELRVHEYPHDLGRRSEARAMRAMWQAPSRVVVHTERERDELAAITGRARERIAVMEHGAHFIRRTALDRDEARRRLELPHDAFVFLSIGFLQPHKGFDRAVRAFGDLGARGARLEIVGSLRLEEPEYVAYVDELHALAEATPGVTLHETYVTDELFDVWIVAADALVLPYRLIWSSGVCERAALYDRPIIATRTGGLADQAPDTAILVDDDRGLAEAMHRLVTGAAGEAEPAGPWPEGSRDAVMAEIRARAAARRPGTHASGAAASVAVAERTAPVRRLTPLAMPAPISARPGASLMKRLVRRVTAWEVDPLVRQVNALRQAVIEALEDGPEGGADRRRAR